MTEFEKKVMKLPSLWSLSAGVICAEAVQRSDDLFLEKWLSGTVPWRLRKVLETRVGNFRQFEEKSELKKLLNEKQSCQNMTRQLFTSIEWTGENEVDEERSVDNVLSANFPEKLAEKFQLACRFCITDYIYSMDQWLSSVSAFKLAKNDPVTKYWLLKLRERTISSVEYYYTLEQSVERKLSKLTRTVLREILQDDNIAGADVDTLNYTQQQCAGLFFKALRSDSREIIHEFLLAFDRSDTFKEAGVNSLVSQCCCGVENRKLLWDSLLNLVDQSEPVEGVFCAFLKEICQIDVLRMVTYFAENQKVKNAEAALPIVMKHVKKECTCYTLPICFSA